MQKLFLVLLAAGLAAACSHSPKKPHGTAFPINPAYQERN
ncbi:putative lipoprotein [Neisseria musculi]|uniref:Lipoprotein n=1 Tax=Neisseria musculi TaxID=1815583 RepID=A0A7H1MEF5_9NEIS|nr:putative lipoprotein [Neisseria musculi]